MAMSETGPCDTGGQEQGNFQNPMETFLREHGPVGFEVAWDQVALMKVRAKKNFRTTVRGPLTTEDEREKDILDLIAEKKKGPNREEYAAAEENFGTTVHDVYLGQALGEESKRRGARVHDKNEVRPVAVHRIIRDWEVAVAKIKSEAINGVVPVARSVTGISQPRISTVPETGRLDPLSRQRAAGERVPRNQDGTPDGPKPR